MSKTVIRLIIVDDHPMVREGLKVSLDSEPGLEVQEAVANGLEAIEAAQRLAPDVLLLDISMPEMGGFETCTRFRNDFPETRLLIVTMHESREYIMRAIQSGAAGYVLKDAPIEELVLAAQTVHQGGTYFSSSVAKTLFSELGDLPPVRPKSGDQTLTGREIEVLALLTEGMGNKEIARKLDISVRTVEAHRFKIKQKLGISNSAGLIRYALDNGIGKSSN
jgi:two-component system nitrate/nitrite response regulator NarL